MAKRRLLALAAALILCLQTILISASAATFQDVADTSWYAGAVYFCADNSIFNGLSDELFGPGETMTRGMFVTVLGRMEGVPVDHNRSTGFTDVPKGQYYTGYVAWAKANRIVSGVTETEFCPDQPITRQEMCTMIYRYARAAGLKLNSPESTPTFVDDAAISDWAKAGVYACKGWGLVQGNETGAFCPTDTAKRSETAQVLKALVLAINATDKTYWPDWESAAVVNHRGYNSLAPENTISAFRKSLELGYCFVETDVQFTSDGVPVLLHDSTINRTARNADGSPLSSTVYLKDITFNEVRQYDFGIFSGSQYAGETIPSFAEFIAFCHDNSLHPYLEIKQAMTTDQVRMLYNQVLYYNMQDHVTWIGFTSMAESLETIVDLDPSAEIGILSGTLSSVVYNLGEKLKTDQNYVFLDVTYMSLDQETADTVLSRGFGLQVWTLDSADYLETLKAMGVTGITTNLLPANSLS
jgi:glycerophosphoryl diester phosphodiesterase